MAKKLQLRRGTTTQHNSFTGAEGEVTVDTDKETLVVHNGSTAGGFPVARATGETFTGNVVLDNDKEVRFSEADSNGSAYIGLKAPTDLGSVSSYTLTLPTTAAATGKVLKTDSSTATQLVWGDDTAGLAAPSSAGTVDASKGVQVDANKDVTGFRNVTLTGELDAATGDFSGDVDIDGTANLDNVDIDGTVTVGANDAGFDVILYGDTASANVTWDTSADELILNGAAGVTVPDGQLTLGSTAVTSTAAELNTLDGFTGDKDDLIYAKDLKATGVTATEFDYLDDVTSNIQTQLNAKQAADADTAKTDVDQEWSKPQRGNIVDNGTISSGGGTSDFDLDAGNNFKIDIDATVELGFSNLDASREGQTGTIYVDNAAITPTWGSEVQFEGGTDGTISITKSAKSVLAYYVLPGGAKVLVTAVLDVKDD